MKFILWVFLFKPNRGLAKSIPSIISCIPPVTTVVRGPSWHIRLEIGRGAARTRATPGSRMHTGEKGTFCKVRVCRILIVKTVSSGERVGRCHSQGLPQRISHIPMIAMWLQPLNPKLSDMHTTRLPAMIAVVICKGNVVRVIHQGNTVYR